MPTQKELAEKALALTKASQGGPVAGGDWITRRQVEHIYSISRSTIRRWIQAGVWPQPLRLVPNGRPLWKRSECDACMEAAKEKQPHAA